MNTGFICQGRGAWEWVCQVVVGCVVGCAGLAGYRLGLAISRRRLLGRRLRLPRGL